MITIKTWEQFILEIRCYSLIYLSKRKVLTGTQYYSKGYTSIVIHKTIINWFIPNNMGTDPLKFRFLVIQGLVKKHGCAVLQSAYGHPSIKLPPKRNISYSKFSTQETWLSLTGGMSYAENTENEVKHFIGAVNVKRNSV